MSVSLALTCFAWHNARTAPPLLRPAGLLLFSAAQRYSRVLFLAHARVAGLSGDFRVSAIVNNAGVSMGVLTFLRDSDLISSGNMPEVELLDLLATLFF